MKNETINTFDETQFAHLKGILPPKDYEEFISFQKNKPDYEKHKESQRLEGRKKEAGQDFFARRQTIVMRNVDVEKYAPDENVLAYIDIHKMKKAQHKSEGTYEDKMKIPVSDDEINAFCSLENEGRYYKDITLGMVAEKVKANENDTNQEHEETPLTDAH